MQLPLIIVVDEFDCLKDRRSRKLMADTIKALSDHSVDATIFIVGVADSVDSLIADHNSISRAMAQIQMPRMDDAEIKEIVQKGLERFNSQNHDFQITASEKALQWIIMLARGLPHYAHLLAQKACYTSIEKEEREITFDHLMQGVLAALEETRQTTLTSFDKAVYSAHKNATLRDTLEACALAQTNQSGFFSPSDVRKPLCQIRKKEQLQIASFIDHLEQFCGSRRGSILQKSGDSGRVRYRFADALIPPYVIMRGLVDGRIAPPTFATAYHAQVAG
jgi:Cdc6-like AAA superfamily ATPase